MQQLNGMLIGSIAGLTEGMCIQDTCFHWEYDQEETRADLNNTKTQTEKPEQTEAPLPLTA